MTRSHATAYILSTFATLALSLTAHAQVWNEVGDAGRDGVAAAQNTVGAGPLTTINGTLNVPTDVDLYCIRITDEAIFRASVTSFILDADPALFLFNADGTLQVHNDDFDSSLLSTITSQGVFTNGTYYLGIGNLPNYPLTASNTVMATFVTWPGPDADQRQSTGGILASWNDSVGFPAAGGYSISLQGAEFHLVPSPGASVMLALGGLLAARRRRVVGSR